MASLTPMTKEAPGRTDRELYAMRSRGGTPHLIEVTPISVGLYHVWLDGQAACGGRALNEEALEKRLAFFRRMAADWLELQPDDALHISEDLLCP